MTRPYAHILRSRYLEGSCFESAHWHRPSRPEVFCGVSPILQKSSGTTSQFSRNHFLPNSIQLQLLPSKFYSTTYDSFLIQFSRNIFLPNSIQPHTLPSKFNSTTCSSSQIQFNRIRLLKNSLKFLNSQSSYHSSLLSAR